MAKVLILSAVVFGLTIVAPAQAKVVRVIHEGMVEDALGSAQLFGAPNSSLVGMHVLSIYEFDCKGPCKCGRELVNQLQRVIGASAVAPVLPVCVSPHVPPSFG